MISKACILDVHMEVTVYSMFVAFVGHINNNEKKYRAIYKMDSSRSQVNK